MHYKIIASMLMKRMSHLVSQFIFNFISNYAGGTDLNERSLVFSFLWCVSYFPEEDFPAVFALVGPVFCCCFF